MQRKITVFAPWMEADLRRKIMDRVQETGLKAAFFDREEDAAADARDAEILFGVSRRCLSEARELRWLCVPFAGIDSLRDLIPEGVRLSNGAGAYGITISEHVVMVLLMMLRHAEQTLKDMGAKVWRKAGAMETLYDKRVLILGTGDIGRECAARLAAFRVKRISGVNRSGHAAEGFDEGYFTRARRASLGARLRALEDFDSVCVSMASGVLEGYCAFDSFTLLEGITAEDCRRFVRENLTPERMALSVIRPKRRAAES